MLLTLVFLAALFIVGVITTFFNLLPAKKFIAWYQSLFTTSSSNSTQNVSTNQISIPRGKKKGELKSVFATFDKNNDGFITKKELRDSLKNIGITVTEKEVVEMVEKVDSNGDGLIDLDEFCELFESTMMSSGSSSGDQQVIGGKDDEEGGEGDLKEAFDVFDGDGDGLITVDELGLVLSSLGLMEGKMLENCKEMIRKVDMDGDGMVNFDEFKRMMKAGGSLVSVS
ncbi:calmodulin-like protein 7 [Cornus florida]|uniref:calmodulin-like protein 7 n=1 Tax=Cornus florida TaxID=4283 RepID=UPI002896FD3C|nr:calmodulin-like protein 7 [Cornus florida]